MSANGNQSSSGSSGNGTQPSGPSGVKRAVPDVIDFQWDANADGPIAANQVVRGSDWSDIDGQYETDTNEVLEVYGISLIAPITTGSPDVLDAWEELRLWDGDSYYPHLRPKAHMLGHWGPDTNQRSVPLGQPVLSGENNPNNNPIGTATPKFGTRTAVSPAIVNDGTAIDEDFTVRLHVWRYKGSQSELSRYISQSYGTTSFPQRISMSNPFTGNARTYTRARTTTIAPGADGGAHGQFTRLTGGIDQMQPKVYPWMTAATNNKATRTNTPYQFTTRNDRVVNSYEQLEFDLTDEREARIFSHIGVDQVANLKEGKFVIEERDDDPRIKLSNDGLHELPLLRDPETGALRDTHDGGGLPVALEDRLGRPQVLWDDGGGFRITDDGTSIAAGELLVTVYGKVLELTS